MLKFSLYYEDKCDSAEYLPIQDAIMAGENWADICEKYDDWIITDEAAVDLAIRLGWDCNSFIESELIELANSYVDYDCENTDSLRKLLVNEALDYIDFQRKAPMPR